MSGNPLFERLKALLEPYRAGLVARTDSDTHLYLEETRSTGKPQLFAAVQVKKSYTAFHLYPLYTHPELVADLDPALLKRMQGKSCFNFTKPEQVPEAALAALLQRSHQTLGEP
jgi:hypothetical protein